MGWVRHFFLYVACVAGLSSILMVSILFWPVDRIVISRGAPSSGLYLFQAPLGTVLQTRIIHSVQLSPVVDCYKPLHGNLWVWQEWIQSHNAGLPSLAPEFGRLWYDPPWMVVEGGHTALQQIIYRVGTDELGHNEFAVLWPWESENTRWIPLYKEFPGERLYITAVRRRTDE